MFNSSSRTESPHQIQHELSKIKMFLFTFVVQEALWDTCSPKVHFVHRMPPNVHFAAHSSVARDIIVCDFSSLRARWNIVFSLHLHPCLSLLRALLLSHPLIPLLIQLFTRVHVDHIFSSCLLPSPRTLSLHHLYIHLFTSLTPTYSTALKHLHSLTLSAFTFRQYHNSSNGSLALPSAHLKSSCWDNQASDIYIFQMMIFLCGDQSALDRCVKTNRRAPILKGIRWKKTPSLFTWK